MKIAYTAQAHATGGGREGHVKTSDDRLDLTLAPPTEMGGSGEGTNPEQLFASGYSACFLSALQGVARSAKADATGSSVKADVGIGPNDEGGYALAVTLEIGLPRVPRDTAEELAKKAHQVCPYSNATRGNVDVELKVVDAA